MSSNNPVTPIERYFESTMQVKDRKGKGVAASEEQLDSKSRPYFFVSKRNNKSGNPTSRNVYQIPQNVIRDFLQSGLSRIQVVDSDGGERWRGQDIIREMISLLHYTSFIEQ
ncbi:unnamed protein product [Vicia faba]|uniref:Uncharacterized protein n=1 Tax=Vicia faba TaxID=3906 RepID=A0AAV0ZJS3_VICFA|nr:unnamed protein product [Vicia faba]